MDDGIVLDIQRCCVHDGPGIRTAVFLKGCPLRCRWCHNPQSIAARPEILFRAERCTGCGACRTTCATACDRMACSGCGACTSVCAFGARTLAGRRRSVDNVLVEVARDRAVYERSGGGLTISGGEPFAQPAFTIALAQAARTAGIHVCIETCGHAPTHALTAAAPHVDLWLFDLKESDDARHRACTGVGMETIQRNLAHLDTLGARIILRCPLVPGVNDHPDHLASIAATAERYAGITEVQLMPYHPYAQHRYAELGRPYALAGVGAPHAAITAAWRAAVGTATGKPVRI